MGLQSDQFNKIVYELWKVRQDDDEADYSDSNFEQVSWPHCPPPSVTDLGHLYADFHQSSALVMITDSRARERDRKC